MTISDININFASVLPQVLLTGLALSILVLDLFLGKRSKAALGYITIIGLLIILPVAFVTVSPEASFGMMVTADSFSAFFNVIFIIAALFAVLISMDYLKKVGAGSGEYYYIILFATLGMMIMASAADLINLYVGLELMALSFYVLVAFRVDERRSVEGALKYFVLGALSSGILLYGISFVYGFSGTTNLAQIARHAVTGSGGDPFLSLAIALIAIGFCFKIAAFPFHMWAPDAYEGAPTPVTAFLSVGSKAAAFAVFLRVFITAFSGVRPQWSGLLWTLSVATMIFGSVVAISQKNIVRMLAYSSIAHAGIIMIGLLTYNAIGASGVMYYLLVYAFMNMGAFTVVALFIRDGGAGEAISDYKGLAASRPGVAFLMSLFLFSLAGIPPTGGFTAKFFILASAISAHYYWLAAIGVLATAISLFFYAKVIFYMYMKEPDDFQQPLPAAGFAYNIALFAAAAGTLILGIYPTPFIDMAMEAIKPFF